MFAGGSDGGAIGSTRVRRVYASLPLTGPTGPAGREVLRGAELALEGSAGTGVELVALDASGEDRDARAAANARRAAGDAHALAYLGDFHSSQVMTTAPVLSQAGMLQVAPVATFTGLHGSTLVRLMPTDGALAHGIAGWLAEVDVGTLLVVHDHDHGYGIPVGRMCAEAARERGLDVRLRPIWDEGEPMTDDVRSAQAVLYVGVAGSGAVGLWRDLHALDSRMWLIGTDGVAAPWLARELSAEAAERTRFFGAQRAPWGFYGFESMALIVDAVAAGHGDRAETTRAALSTSDRESILGRYSIDDKGLTTSTACGRLAVVSGELVWDRAGLPGR
jgi:branched-chain amino acid transport system substrate-binding protein